MSHGITSTDHMMSVHEVPWHGLGTILEGLATAEEAIKAAKLDWDVSVEPVVTSGGVINQKWNQTVRSDNGQPLGVVGRLYKPVPNREAFTFFDEVTNSPGGPKYTTAGSLWGGSKVWMLAELPQTLEVVPGDVVKEFLLLVNGHDGLTKAEMFYTPVRVVCNNTLSMAMDGKKGSTFKFRHLGSIMNHVGRAQEILGLVQQNHEALKESTQTLLDYTPSEEEVDTILAELFKSYIPEKVTSQTNKIREKVKELSESGAGQDIPGVKGTGWALYNGVTEYTDHFKPFKPRFNDVKDTKLESLWFGEVRSFKASAFDTILDSATKEKEKVLVPA